MAPNKKTSILWHTISKATILHDMATNQEPSTIFLIWIKQLRQSISILYSKITHRGFHNLFQLKLNWLCVFFFMILKIFCLKLLISVSWCKKKFHYYSHFHMVILLNPITPILPLLRTVSFHSIFIPPCKNCPKPSSNNHAHLLLCFMFKDNGKKWIRLNWRSRNGQLWHVDFKHFSQDCWSLYSHDW